MHLAVFVDNKLMDETGANIRLLNFQLKIEKTSYLYSAASSAGQVKLQWGQAARHIRNATSNLTASSPCIWYEQETVCLSFSLSRLHSLHAAVHACVCVCVCVYSSHADLLCIPTHCSSERRYFALQIEPRYRPFASLGGTLPFGCADMCRAVWGTTQTKAIYQRSCWRGQRHSGCMHTHAQEVHK